MSQLHPVSDGIARVLAALVLACSSLAASGHELPSASHAGAHLQIAAIRYPPLMTQEQDGYLDLILKELFTRTGVDHEWVDTPPRRGVNDTNAGVLDAVLLPFPDVLPGYADLLTLAEPLLPTYIAGLYTRDDMSIATIDDFFNYRVAHVRGWYQMEHLFEGHDSVEEVRSPRLMMEMLASDRVDVVLFSVVLGRYIADEIGLQDLKVSEFQINRNLYLHFNKRYRDLLPTLNDALVNMKEDGTMSSILTGYDSGR